MVKKGRGRKKNIVRTENEKKNPKQFRKQQWKKIKRCKRDFKNKLIEWVDQNAHLLIKRYKPFPHFAEMQSLIKITKRTENEIRKYLKMNILVLIRDKYPNYCFNSDDKEEIFNEQLTKWVKK
eukprot:35236_1